MRFDVLFRLSKDSPLPLREQIVRRIRELVLRGDLAEDDPLPSIRRLAQQQRVGVVTVQRAYEDLEREGIVYARQGKGYFVASLSARSRETEARARTKKLLERPLHEARQMGLTVAEIETIVRRLLSEEEDRP